MKWKNKRHKKYYKRNRKKISNQKKKYYKKNRKSILKKQKEYEERTGQHRRYYLEHQEKEKKRGRINYQRKLRGELKWK